MVYIFFLLHTEPARIPLSHGSGGGLDRGKRKGGGKG